MQPSLTLNGLRWPRAFSFLAGLGMIVFSALTINHFFAANYPASIYQGSFCDINSFFNCNSSAYSVISAVWGVPLGFFGVIVGALVSLGAVFPSEGFERTNKTIALVNVLGVVSLFLFSVLYLKSLCLLCSGFYAFSIVSFVLFWRYGMDRQEHGVSGRWLRFSFKYVVTFAVITAVGAWGMRTYHNTKKEAQSGGVAARIVRQYFGLPTVKTPSIVSPYWTVKSTEKFEDAPIQVIEYADFLCPDCQYLNGQLEKLAQDYKGKVNIAFQFFPLEAKCNNVVAKDKHPGACDLAYIAAYDTAKFNQLHHELFANFKDAHNPEWRRQLAQRYGVEAALTDKATQDKVLQIINTGAEFDKTSDQYAHGIRSTPTMIINNRMVIGTFPYEQLRAIFQALIDKSENNKYMEHWQE
jgi:protein-disulfide isomerase/uncharacterized membrane protein